MADALTFTEKLVSNSQFNTNPVILGWRGRVLIYSGSETLGKKILQEGLKNDPDNAVLQKATRNIKKATEMKEQAAAMFKNNNIEGAVEKFRECLLIDPLNLNYNASIHLNIAIGLNKKGKNEEALDALNRAVLLNPRYAKAFVKKGEVNQKLGNY